MDSLTLKLLFITKDDNGSSLLLNIYTFNYCKTALNQESINMVMVFSLYTNSSLKLTKKWYETYVDTNCCGHKPS